MADNQQGRLGKSPREAVKSPVIVSSIANITLTGLPIISGVQLVEGDRVLVKDQSDSTQNGIYCAFVGNWDRAKDWNKSNDVINGQLVVDSNSGQIYRTQFEGEFFINSTNVLFFETLTGEYARNFPDFSSLINDASMALGQAANVKEHTQGNGGSESWDAVLLSSVTPDPFFKVASLGNNSLALSLRVNSPFDVTKIGTSKVGIDSSSEMIACLANTDIKSHYLPSGAYSFAGNLPITHTPLTIEGDGVSTVVDIANTEDSNGLYLPSGGKDVTIRKKRFTSTPTAGKATQAITLVDCVGITIEDVTIDGFTQFPISLRFLLGQAYGNVNIKRVIVTDGSFAGVGVSNAFEIFAGGGGNGFIDNLVVEDSSFSIGTGKGGNIAKFGVSTRALINRCRFNAVGRTGESSSSGVENGSSSNTTKDYIEYRECIFNDVGQTTGLYALASRATETLLTNPTFPAGNNSIFFPSSVEEFKVVGGFISKILFGSVTIDKFHMLGGEIEQTLTIENADIPDFTLEGVKLTTLTLGAATATTNVTLIDCDIDTVNTITGTVLGKLTVRGKAPKQMALNSGVIDEIDICGAELEINNLTHFLKATQLMEIHHITCKAGNNNLATTNMIQIDSDARFSHNYVADVNRTFHVTVANGAVLDATNNTHYDSVDNNVYGVISGTVNKISNAINGLLDPP